MKTLKLTPIPIRTKNKGFFSQILVWLLEVRSWEVAEDWKYLLPDETTLVIPKGFAFDGASIPRPLWGILSPTGLLLIPGLVHDFGYRFDYIWALNSEGYVYKNHEKAGKEYWDNLFYDVGEKVNGMKVINVLAWAAISLMGRSAWNSNRARNEPDLPPGNHPIQPSVNGLDDHQPEK